MKRLTFYRTTLCLTVVAAVAITASVTTVTVEAQKKPTTSVATATDKKIDPIDLNTADAKALADVPGVGEKLAAVIIKARPFKSVDDLKKVKGIGEGKKFDTLKPYFMVAPEKPVAAGSGQTSVPAAAASNAKSTTTRSGGRGSASTTSKLAAGEKININTATAEQLDKLPDIGPVKAKAIIDYRTAHGAFATIEDVMKVDGIKEGIFAKIKDSIVVR